MIFQSKSAKKIDLPKEEYNHLGRKREKKAKIKFSDKGNIRTVEISPNIVNLNSGEVILWRFFGKVRTIGEDVVLRYVLSNYRIMLLDPQNSNILEYFLLMNLHEVLVINKDYVFRLTHNGVYEGRYMLATGPSFSSWTSTLVGDIVLLFNGQKITWRGIPDPTVLKNFIMTLKRTLYDPITES